MRRILIALKHPQPPTPIRTDNTTAQSIINNTAKQRKSRAMDMRYYWLRDRIKQGQFMIYWRPGTENYGDYFTKHHPTAHHQKMRSVYITAENEHNANYSCTLRRGCVNNHNITAEVRGARTAYNGTHARTLADTVKLNTVITAIVEAVRRRTGRIDLLLNRIL